MNDATRQPTKEDNKPLPLITSDVLVKDFAYLTAEIEALEKRGTEAPSVLEDDEDLTLINELAKDAKVAQKRAGKKLHDDVKQPYLDAGRVVDDFFFALRDRMGRLVEVLETNGGIYLDRKRKAEESKRKAEEDRQRALAAEKQAEAAKAIEQGKPAEAEKATVAAGAAFSRAAEAAKPIEPTKVKTGAGTASLDEYPVVKITDWNALDLNILKPFIKRQEVEDAIYAIGRNKRDEFKAGTFKIVGVEMAYSARAKLR